jgi:hypothetical protein
VATAIAADRLTLGLPAKVAGKIKKHPQILQRGCFFDISSSVFLSIRCLRYTRQRDADAEQTHERKLQGIIKGRAS